MKKFFNVLLVALMIITGSFTRVYAEPSDDGNETGSSQTFVQDIDPSTLNIHTLGEEAANAKEEKAEPAYGDRDVVRVSIVLEKPATLDIYSAEDVADNAEAMAYRESLQDEQDSVTRKIEDELNSELDVQWNLTLAANIISANVEFGDIDAIKNVKGVEDVFVENRYELHDEVNTSLTTEYMVGAQLAWASGYTGAGSRVAIIDTGANQDHISFDPDAFEYSLTKDGGSLSDYNLLTTEEIDGVLEQLNQNNTAAKHNIDSAADVYKNSKIPFAFNYIDGNYTTDHYSDTQGEHGSHVAGTAAANRYIKTGQNEYTDALNSVYAVGVAPDAQILVMKVFGVGGGAYDSDYFAAIEDAIILKADSINLSLGSGNPGSSFAGAYQGIMDSLIDSSTAVVMSAGNSYNWSYAATNIRTPNGNFGELYLDDISEATAGSPGSFFNSLGVAAAQNVGITGTPLKYRGMDIYYTETDSSGPALKTLAKDEEYEFVYIDALGNLEEYVAVNSFVELKGKIVMVNRGSISFYVKGNNLIDFEPAALIVVNNQPGTISMALDDYTGTFPMVSITQDDGNLIKASSVKNTVDVIDYYTGTIQISKVIKTYVDSERDLAPVTDFSSWGVPGSLSIKPEITAPGGNIWSVNGMTDDDYELMSGTSMAAPHITGMMALMAQYIRENDLSEKVNGITPRALMNSLLMSTATPMFNEYGLYLPILQQGAGLADVDKAINAKSFITMSGGSTLSDDSAIDGKVKAEFGQDAQRTGRYAYSFTINNLSAEDLDYTFGTDVFTQDAYEYGGQYYLDTYTTYLDADVTYSYEVHDVDMDGDTDTDDVQAILDYLVGNRSAESVDLAAGEMDGEEGLSTHDAQLLLECIQRTGDEILRVPAGGSAEVSVIINVNDEQLTSREKGGYVEGFTYVACVSETEDGAYLGVEHSIPFLGYYGSWTDPGMTDPVSALDAFYPTGKNSYFGGTNNTNFMEVKYPGRMRKTAYTGNPYIAEEQFPADRLAISSDTKISSFKRTYIRNAGTAATIVLDKDQNLLYSANETGDIYSAFYYVNGGAWMNTSATVAQVNRTVSDFGKSEGDSIFVAQFAIPEYYALMLDSDAKSGQISVDDLLDLYKSGELGEGSYLGYTMEIDDAAPELDVSFDEEAKTVNVKASDNTYIAYLALTDVGGNTVYEGFVPQMEKGGTFEYSFDVSNIDSNAVVVFAGDYAANEKARLAKIGEGPIIREIITPVYRLTDTVKADSAYLISNSDQEGKAVVLASQGTQNYTATANVVIYEDEDGAYIPMNTVEDTSVWNSFAADEEDEDVISFQNASDGGWLGFNNIGYPYVNWASASYADPFYYVNNLLLYVPYAAYGYGMYYDSDISYFMFGRADYVYLYEPGEHIEYEEVDPKNASSVELSVSKATLILGVSDELEIAAVVEPNFIEDRSVKWSSSDESVAVVDGNGLVKGVGVGTAIITATSNQTPSVSASAEINVVTDQPIDAYVFGQVAYGDEIEFDLIDLNSMETYSFGEALAPFYGGGESGVYIYGNDTDNDYYRYVINDDYSIEYDGSFNPFSIVDRYALLDGANIPYIEMTLPAEEGEEPEVYGFDFDIIGVGKSNYLQLMKDSNLNYFKLEEVSENQFVAIAFAGAYIDEEDGTTYLYYYAMDSEGVLYLLGLYTDLYEGEPDISMLSVEIGKLNVLTMSEDLTAYSMVYAASQTGKDSLFISDNTTKSIYYVDLSDEEAVEFDAQYVGSVSGATNLSTLFDLYYDSVDVFILEKLADKLSGSKTKLHSEKIESIAVEPESADEVQTAETAESVEAVETVVEEEPVAEEAPIIEEEPAPEENIETVGALNAVTNNIYRKKNFTRNVIVFPEKNIEVEPDPENKNIVDVIYTEDIEIKNGLVIVRFNPYVSKYLDYQSDVDFNAINVDQKNGVIKFACAQLDPIPAEDIIAEFEFAKGCDNTEFTIETIERGEELNLKEEEKEEIIGTGHRYYLSAWMWGEDNNSATVYFTCMNNSDHREKVAATVTSETVATNPDGSREVLYTATAYFNGKQYQDSRKIVIPAPSSDGNNTPEINYEFVGWEWSEDGKTCYAVFKNPETGETIRIEAAMSETVIEATENEDGSIEYKATVTVGGVTYTDVRKVTLEKKNKDSDSKKDEKDDSSKPEKETEPDSSEVKEGKTLSVLDVALTLGTLCAALYMALVNHDFKGLAVALASLLAAALTQGFGGRTVFADKWSALFGVLLALAVALMVLGNRKKDQ